MKVTILHSVYNTEKFLPRALECINTQTYKNIEYYLCDHGSTDNSLNIINEFKCKFECHKKKYDRIPEDYEYTGGRICNDILYDMKGELFYWQATDDILSENFILNNVIQYLNNPTMKIWQSPIWWFDGNVFEIAKMEREPRGFFYKDMEDLKNKMLKESVVNCPSVFMNVEILRKIGGIHSEYMNAGDYELWFRLIDNDYFIYPINKFLGLFYCIHSNQCTNLLHIKKDGYPIEKLQREYKEKWKK